MNFWREFVSGSNQIVNSMAVLAVVLAAPVVAIASASIIFHVFILKKGLDGPTVNLLLGMLGAATGGLGASMFSKTTFNQTIASVEGKVVPSSPEKAAKMEVN